jgi:hypothetical protein
MGLSGRLDNKTVLDFSHNMVSSFINSQHVWRFFTIPTDGFNTHNTKQAAGDRSRYNFLVVLQVGTAASFYTPNTTGYMVPKVKKSTIMLAFLLMLIVSIPLALPQPVVVAKPTIPEFTAKYVNNPYERQPTTTTNPYTGEITITDPGGTYDNWTLVVTVKNQKVTSTKDSSGNWIELFYNVGYKGHYEDRWAAYPLGPENGYVSASKSGTTVIELPPYATGGVPDGGLFDIKVQALIGTQTQGVGAGGVPGGYIIYVFQGETGDWSNIQTLTLTRSAITPTQPPTASQEPSPQIPTTPLEGAGNQLDEWLFDLDWRVVSAVLFVGVVVLACTAVGLWRGRHVKTVYSV